MIEKVFEADQAVRGFRDERMHGLVAVEETRPGHSVTSAVAQMSPDRP